MGKNLALKSARAAKGLRQFDLAKKLRISTAKLSRLENGTGPEATTAMKFKICKILGKTVQELFGTNDSDSRQ